MRKIGKRILVTGADGFIGSHLVESLLEGGCGVRAFVQYNSFNSRGWLDHFPGRTIRDIEILAGDVRDPHFVERAMKGCDVVFHLASLIAIPFSYQSPDSYVDTNIKGALNILQGAGKNNVREVIMTSTSEVYGTAKRVPMDELHPRNAQSPYAATKTAADELALSFYRSFGLPVKIVRPFNTYGPRQSARAIIPAIIIQLLSGSNKAIKLGNLSPTRDLTFVKDTVSAFIEVAGSGALAGEVTNVGMNHEVSIHELADMIARLMHKKIKIEKDATRVRPAGSEVERLRCDNSKLLSRTGWRPKYDLEKGIGITIDWFRKNLNKYKPDDYNI